MKLRVNLCLLFCFLLWLCKAQTLPIQSPFYRIEIFSSTAELATQGTMIERFDYLEYDKNTKNIIVYTVLKNKITLPAGSVWGYKIYAPNGKIKLYRIPEIKYSGYLSSPEVIDTSGLIIYRSGRQNGKYTYYYFSKDLNSPLYNLSYSYLSDVFKSSNPYFLKIADREFGSFVSYHAINKRTGNYVVAELYRYSLLHKDDPTWKDTLNYHLRTLKSDGKYWLFNIRVNQFVANHDPGDVITRIPYSSRDTTTGVTQNQVAFTDTHPFSQKPLFIDFSLEHNRFKNCFAMQVGYANNYNKSFHFGLYYGLANDLKLSEKKNKKLTLKAGVNVSYYSFSVYANDIDNTNKYITVFNKTYRPSFVVAHTHRYSATTYSYYNSSNVRVYYSVRSWDLCPQISLANNRDHRFYWALNAGWDIVFYDNSGFTFSQFSGKILHKEDHVAFNQAGLSSNQTGNGLFKSPFKFGGPNFGISVGFYLNK